MKQITLIISLMLLYLNMTAQVQLGNVLLKNVSQFEINENVLEMSNTAKITIPRNYGQLAGKSILEQFKVGDKVVIQCGYDGDLQTEFVGYIREIESDRPVVVHCDDETYPLRQTNYVKTYKATGTTLKQILADIIPASFMRVECPNVVIGKYQIDNASAFVVLQDLMQSYGLYSRLQNGVLKVGLAYDFADKAQNHTYVIGKNTKKNELKFKRKEDLKLRFKAVATNPNGKKTTVTVGSKDSYASERTLNFAGPMTEDQLRKLARGVMQKNVYDGYTGSISGFCIPRTHAGDALAIKDVDEPEREGKFLIERVDITYDDNSGITRKNSLSFKLG